MREQIAGKTFDEERALYYLQHADVQECTFAGPADGESVLKEARDVALKNCNFSLRYPLWHVRGFRLENCTMDEKTRSEKADVIAYALSQTGADPEKTWMIGDRKYDILGGKAFGMKTVGVLYGYGSREELAEAGADHLCQSVSELKEVFFL